MRVVKCPPQYTLTITVIKNAACFIAKQWTKQSIDPFKCKTQQNCRFGLLS